MVNCKTLRLKGCQKKSNAQSVGLRENVILDLTNPIYRPDKDYPESYKKGFEEGKKNGCKHK